MSEKLILIVGCSVRAAAWSAKRAGLRIFTADQFGDRDLSPMTEHHLLIQDDWDEVTRLMGSPEIEGWLYTGGIENQPEFIEKWTRMKPLLGNSAEVVRQVRDPFLLHKTLQQSGIPMLKLERYAVNLSAERQWLRKSYKSGGGIQVEFADSVSANELPETESYFQEYQSGVPFSASCLGENGQFELLGFARQFIKQNDEVFRAGDSIPFLFAGGIAPVELSNQVSRQVRSIGECLVRQFGLSGLFGLDFILDQQGQIWLLEVNPRYTATMELLERQTGQSFMAKHTECYPEQNLDLKANEAPTSCEVFSKQIIYAPGAMTAPAIHFFDEFLVQDLCVEAADLPEEGLAITAGEPVCTLIARGTTENESIKRLQENAQRFMQTCVEKMIVLDGSEF